MGVRNGFSVLPTFLSALSGSVRLSDVRPFRTPLWELVAVPRPFTPTESADFGRLTVFVGTEGSAGVLL